MIDEDFIMFVEEASLTLSYSEVESLVAFLKNFDNCDLPETIKDDILPKMCDFIVDEY